MSDKQLKQYLQKLDKEQVIGLYLQKCHDQEFLRSEILTNIYNEIMDSACHQLNIFNKWDLIISQDKFKSIFNKGGSDEDSDIT